MIDVSRYTIGWVCAILPELVAARLQLDTEHDADDYEAQPNDDNTYAFGSIGKHDVVIAALPTGEYGISSASRVARDMIRSFPNLRIGLMVGIAGGAPLVQQSDDKKQDIRLGDVVVGIPVNRQGGVYQYTYGKEIQGQKFTPTGHLNSPPISVLAALSMLRADFEMFGNKIDKDVVARLSKLPQPLDNYRRPPPESDRLYKSSFIHGNDSKSCSTVCEDVTMLVERVARDSNRDGVHIHYGLIASADRLMKDATIRDAFAREAGVLCFEMEAAGLMNQFPFLVVRGICDYSDTHKNKSWQGYAAMTAAVYARKVLLRLVPSKVGAEGKLSDVKETKEAVKQVINKVDQIAVHIEQHELAALESDIQSWIAAPNPSKNHNEALELRHDGSGTWILDSMTFKSWQKAEFPLMWIYGISGCGKTVLTSTIIESLRAQNGSVLYFYFDVRDGRRQRLEHALRSLVIQLAQRDRSCHLHIEKLYKLCSAGESQPTVSDLRECLMRMCKDRIALVVLDALDECSDRDQLLTWIGSSVSQNSKIQFIITSRPEQDIKAALTKCLSFGAALEVTQDSVAQDIKAFVHSRIYDGKDEMKRWQSRPKIQHEIETSLIRGANGMFRWVACQLDVLRKCVDPLSLEKALRSLPQGLHATYDRILQAIPQAQQTHAVRILQFLAYSERPLQFPELVDVVAVRLDQHPAFHEDYRMPDPEELACYCSSLTRVVGREDTSLSKYLLTEPPDCGNVRALQLAHASVREYLVSNELNGSFSEQFKEHRAKACIVTISLTYLHEICRIKSGYARSGQTDTKTSQLSYTGSVEGHLKTTDAESRKLKNTEVPKKCDVGLPFHKLAVESWIRFAASAEKEGGDVLNWIYKVLTEVEFYKHFLRSMDKKYRDTATQLPTPLWFATFGGMETTTRRLIEEGIDVNAYDRRYGHALHAASLKGHVGVVRLLIDRDADVNARGGYKYDNMSALAVAAQNGHFEIVKMLVDAGSKINGRQLKSTPALIAASEEGFLEVVSFLLERGANPESTSKDGNALYVASRRGHVKIVEELLNRGAAVNPNGKAEAPLVIAALRGHVKIVELLLSRGADIHPFKPDPLSRATHPWLRADYSVAYPCSALQAASIRGHCDIVRLLLSRGADASADGEAALHSAASRGRLEVVKLLLDSGVQIEKETHSHNALYHASYEGHHDVANLLLERGANITIDTNNRRSHALRAASDGGHMSIVKLLLEKRADSISEQDLLSDTLTSATNFSGYAGRGDNRLSIARLLLDAGANINARQFQSSTGLTALHIAVKKNDLDMVELLLAMNADVNVKVGTNGDISMMEFAADSDSDIQELLREHGAT